MHMALTKMEIAQTIVDQMGGMKAFRVMLGAKPVAITDDDGQHGMKFKWPSRHPSKGNTMVVTLDEGADTYVVKFYNVNRAGAKLIVTMDDVYCDDLIRIFEEQTSWCLRIPRIVGA